MVIRPQTDLENKFGNPRLEEEELAVNPRISEAGVEKLIDHIKQSENKNIDPKVLSKIVEMAYYHGWRIEDIVEANVQDVLTPSGKLKPEYHEDLREYLDYIQAKHPANDANTPLFPGKKGKKYTKRTLRRHFQDVQNEPDYLGLVTLDDLRQAGVCRKYQENIKKYKDSPRAAFELTKSWAGIKQRRALRDYMQKEKGERQGGTRKPQEGERHWFTYQILGVREGAWDSLGKEGAEAKYRDFVKKVDESQNKIVKQDAEMLKRSMRTVLDEREFTEP